MKFIKPSIKSRNATISSDVDPEFDEEIQTYGVRSVFKNFERFVPSGPVKKFTQEEIAALQEYLKKQGKL